MSRYCACSSVSLLLILCASAFGASVHVNPGDDLQAKINTANAGDIVLVQPGTYTNAGGWQITKPLILKSSFGSGVTFLQYQPCTPCVGTTGALWAQVSNVTIDGFTLRGGEWGARAGTIAGNVVDNVILRDLIIDSTPSAANPGNGITLNGTNSVVDSCTVLKAFGNGILVGLGGNNLIMNNRVQQALTQHGIALVTSHDNIVTSNTVTSSASNAITLLGSNGNRIERNALSGYQNDGIAIMRNQDTPSVNNYVGKNVLTPSAFGAGQTVRGSGVWLDGQANGAYIFGNIESGQAEAFVSIFNSNSSYIRGNVYSQNFQGGILVQKKYATLPKPSFHYIQYNYAFSHPNNAQVLVSESDNVVVDHNYLRESGGGIHIGVNPLVNPQPLSTTNVNIFANTLRSLGSPIYLYPQTANVTLFQNRFLNNLNSQVFSLTGAGAKWDSSVYLGGNHYSDYAVSGNPSANSPYTGFQGGAFKDYFPFASETLGKTPEIVIEQPVTGQVMATGSQKTIAWKSQGCVLVDITYTSSAGGGTIVSDYPDFGYYHWTLPTTLLPVADYVIRVTCKNSAGTAIGAPVASGAFTAGTSELVLFSPGQDSRLTSGGTVRVGWRNPLITPVNILLRDLNTSALFTTANLVNGSPAVNLSGTYADIRVPAIRSNRVQIMVQSATMPLARDAVDGFVSVRTATGAFTNPGAPASFLIGRTYELEWVSPQGSAFVDLDFLDNDRLGAAFRPIATNLPDWGHYAWFVPEFWMKGGLLRATFRNAAGVSLGSVTSAAVDILYTSTPGQWAPFYRLNSDITREHLYTTDANEYNVLGTRGWDREGTVGNILNGPASSAGVNAVPYYRVYTPSLLAHHWTSDRNEYFTLRQFPEVFSPEHIVGYIYPQPVPGTIAFHRLLFRFAPIHHWTTDANEVFVLTQQQQAWIPETVAGYLQAVAPQQSMESPSLMSLIRPYMRGRADGVSRASNGALETDPALRKISGFGASLQGPLVPGQVVSLSGQNLSDQTGSSPRAASTRVWFGDIPTEPILTSDQELRAVVPAQLAPGNRVRVKVERDGRKSNAIEMLVVEAMPALLTADLSGRGPALAENEDGSANSPVTGARPGSRITLFLTGVACKSQAVEATCQPALPLAVMIGGISAPVETIGMPRATPGVLAIEVIVPEQSQDGSPVQVVAGGITSQGGVSLSILTPETGNGVLK